MAPANSDSLVDSTIEGLYLSVSDASHWPQALAGLARAFDCPRVSVMRATPRLDGVLDLRVLNHEPGVQKLYNDYYWRLDPTLLLTRDSAVGWWVDGEPVMAPRTTPSREYVDFAVRSGLRFVAGGKVHVDEGSCTLLGLQRPADHRPFGAAEARLYARLAPHIGRTSALAAELKCAELARGLSLAALNALQWPVYAVAGDARLLLANRLGERQLAVGTPFGIRNGRLHCQDLDARGCLMRALDGAVRRRGSAFRVVTGASTWWVRALPLAAQPGTVLLYAAPGNASPPSAEVLQAMLGFSGAEAEVACLLLQGRNVKQIATTRNVSVWTVRAQVREILQKAGVRRQMQLAQLLLALPRVSAAADGPGRVPSPWRPAPSPGSPLQNCG